MFGFGPKLPIDDEAREWVDEGFKRLGRLLGSRRLSSCKTVLPTDEFFPDEYRSTEDCARRMLKRICKYMQVDAAAVELHVYPDETEELRGIMPYMSTQKTHDAAGVYFHEKEGDVRTVGIKGSNLKDPASLVATIAHELGHVILLGGELLEKDTPDMEPLTDLLTVYLGFGIFNGNASSQFKKFRDDRAEGWSAQSIGYLPQQVFGYALAKYAFERGEQDPGWKSYLATNLRSDFSRSLEWLKRKRGKSWVVESGA